MPPPRCAHSPLTEPASPCCRRGWSTRTSSAVRCDSCCQAGKPSRWPSTHCTVGRTAGRRAYGPSSSICGPHTGAAAGGKGGRSARSVLRRALRCSRANAGQLLATWRARRTRALAPTSSRLLRLVLLRSEVVELEPGSALVVVEGDGLLRSEQGRGRCDCATLRDEDAVEAASELRLFFRGEFVVIPARDPVCETRT